MDENLYNFICKEGIFLHGIGEVTEPQTFFKFKSIIERNGLYSKQKLQNDGINVQGKVLNGGHRDTSEEYISLFDPSVPNIKNRLLSDKCKYFLPFNPDVIFFLISSKEIKGKRHENIPFEIIVEEGYIPLDSCVGILTPNKEKIVSFIQQVLNANQKNIPIYDFSFTELIRDKKIKSIDEER